MNKIIKVTRLSTPDDTKQSIKFIVDQLEKNGICYIKNDDYVSACRLFARFCRDWKPKIIVTPGDGKYIKNIVSVDPSYYIERVDTFAFKLRLKPMNYIEK